MMFASKLSSAALDAWRGEKSRIALGICDLSNATVSNWFTICLFSALPVAIPIITVAWSIIKVSYFTIFHVAMAPLSFLAIPKTLRGGVVGILSSVSN
jgi:hypothetical protein